MSDIRDFFSNFSKKEIQAINKLQIDKAKRDFKIFKEQLLQDKCSLCNKDINTYILNNPCMHWLIRPNNLKKKEYGRLFSSNVGYFRFNSYLRWIANTEIPIGNINDLREETSGKKKFEFTIKYKNYEWSLSCSESDFKGHSKVYSSFPHYHLQMRMNGGNFIKFSDFHIPFAEEDIFNFRAMEEAPDKFKHTEIYGASMQQTFDELNPKLILDHTKATKDHKNATFRLQTVAMAKPGKSISGNDLARIAEESKKTGIPMAKLLTKLDLNGTTIISPGDGVPELKKRTPRKR
ncbi:hypothetical protein KKH43_05470 [Patescibacteria group bacterium]|nr:hypothetical protein [Patescibacteria group bacterium]